MENILPKLEADQQGQQLQQQQPQQLQQPQQSEPAAAARPLTRARAAQQARAAGAQQAFLEVVEHRRGGAPGPLLAGMLRFLPPDSPPLHVDLIHGAALLQWLDAELGLPVGHAVPLPPGHVGAFPPANRARARLVARGARGELVKRLLGARRGGVGRGVEAAAQFDIVLPQVPQYYAWYYLNLPLDDAKKLLGHLLPEAARTANGPGISAILFPPDGPRGWKRSVEFAVVGHGEIRFLSFEIVAYDVAQNSVQFRFLPRVFSALREALGAEPGSLVRFQKFTGDEDDEVVALVVADVS